MNVSIEKVSYSDWKNLLKIGRDTFYVAFKDQNTEENMKHYLDERFNETQIKQELAEPYSLFYFVLKGNDKIGYLKLNYATAQSEDMGHEALEIERIYLFPEYYGQHIGTYMMEKAEGIAISLGLKTLWLGVWEENTAAIRFYERCGYARFDTHIYRLGMEDQTDWMMKKQIER